MYLVVLPVPLICNCVSDIYWKLSAFFLGLDLQQLEQKLDSFYVIYLIYPK